MDRSIIRGLAAAALGAVLLCAGPSAAQSANNQTIVTGPAPVVRIQMRSGELTVRTWDRPDVQVASSNPVQTQHFGIQAVARALPGGDVPIFATTVQTPNGPLRLPPEDFSVDGIGGTAHDGVAMFGGDNDATVTVTVPASTALVVVAVQRGTIHINNFHGAAFVARLHNGPIDIAGSSGEGYVEAARGSIAISNSSFNRLRARTAIGNIIFQACNVRQIEVSSIRGSIAYDNGTFAPGLARFETQQGDIALGIASGGLQIGAHSASGQIVSAFDRGTGSVSGSGTDAQAIVNGGGPVVTASSNGGTIFLYNGSIRNKPRLAQRWQARAGQMRAAPKVRICAARRCPP